MGADVTGLTPNATYHYQLVVNNGKAGGADLQLTTSSLAPVTGSVSLVAVSQLNELVTGD